MNTEKEAIRKAKEVQKRLGQGWDIRVWRNLGWHWSLQAAGGRISLYEDFSGKFFALVNLDGRSPGMGDPEVPVVPSRRDPCRAVWDAMDAIRDIFERDAKGFEMLEEVTWDICHKKR